MQGNRDNLCQSAAVTIANADAMIGLTPLEAAWDSIRGGLRRDLGARTFDGWLKPAELGSLDGESGQLDLVMPSQFMADWVRSHFGDRLALAWKSVLPIVRSVRIVASTEGPKPAPLLVLEDIPAAPPVAIMRDVTKRCRPEKELGRRLKELEGPHRLAQEWRTVRDDLEAARRRTAIVPEVNATLLGLP